MIEHQLMETVGLRFCVDERNQRRGINDEPHRIGCPNSS
jgi:hypothetical protein